MTIQCYGLFWRRDAINWRPGKGKRNAFRLLGRRNEYKPSLRLANFREQYGIYILYGNHGSYYVGQTQGEKRGLGARLLEHCRDGHKDEWHSFSWFGFRRVLLERGVSGICKLGKMPQAVFNKQDIAIKDVEALLIRAMSLQNIQHTKFSTEEKWDQIGENEAEHYLARIAP